MKGRLTLKQKLKVASRVKNSKLKTKKRVIPLSENRLSDAVTTIGYEAPGLKAAQKIKVSSEELKRRVGGKAAGLVEMSRLQMPVPPAFNLSTSVCSLFLARHEIPAAVLRQADQAMIGLERALGKKFGVGEAPLLVSVRSGAPASMPGMMDTVLNLGLSTHLTESLARQMPSMARFWWDCYRRLIFMFADVVFGLPSHEFEEMMHREKASLKIHKDADLSAEALERMCVMALRHIQDSGQDFPQDPRVQLKKAMEAVFRSWNSERAVHYRKLNKIPGDWGTSVTVQAMVFGNRNDRSGTGVVFTRNPSTGEKEIYGEFLMNAQGEDVVAGIRTPHPIAELQKSSPAVYREFEKLLRRLEDHFCEVQDVEFTIEDGRLFILQTRHAKRTASATLEHLAQFVSEKRISKEEAISRLSVDQVKQLLHPSLKPTTQKVLGRGLPASPGAVCGRIAFDPETALQMSRAQSRVILVRRETSPEDIMGMAVSEGILTATGGMTSHAAVVGRGMGKSCVVGCSDLRVDEAQKRASLGGVELREGESLTINGSTGEIYLGELPTEAMSWTKSAQNFFSWVDRGVEVKVLANADTPEQARTARSLGAQGIGLCRTEHMFFDAERLRGFRQMILAEDEEERSAALEALLPHQQEDFAAILEAMKGFSVCVRLLDPPLHEFLPRIEDEIEIETLSKIFRVSPHRIQSRIQILHEQNPMLGHRGCRLGITHPEIYLMQVKALALALIANERRGIRTDLKIMIPLAMDAAELASLLDPLRTEFTKILESEGFSKLSKRVRWGTMIELPRSCLMAGQIAPLVDFFSFGTNDLTQTTMGLSRDDAAKFLPTYVEKRILMDDPFESIDEAGVGELIALAVQRGRKVNPHLELGICGEHGGDPKSINFFSRLRFDSVSCSPYRVPIARLALGQEQISIASKATKKNQSKQKSLKARGE